MTPLRTLAAITLVRTVRGRTLWIGGVLALMPIAFAIATQKTLRGDEAVHWSMVVSELLLAILPPLFVAASIGEELDDKTTAYLWSRPLARWSILAGKLLALAPICVALVMVGWIGASAIAGRGADLRTAVALGAGALGASVISAAIATLAPRHGMALAICYLMFIDLPIGALPASLQALSVTHHVRVFSDPIAAGGTVAGSAIALAVVCAVWAAIALWRIRRLEA